MVTITFNIDSDEYSIDIDPPMGDLDVVYRQQDSIRQRVQEAGYEFVDEPPAYHVLSRSHRKSRDSSTIELGDITGKVAPTDEPATVIDADESAEQDEAPESDEVEITLVDSEGNEMTDSFGERQALGAVSAAVKQEYDIGRRLRVDIYRSRERQRSLPSETPVSSMDGETLFWETSERR